MSDPYSTISTRQTVQTAQADPRQERQAGGGYTFVADPLTRFRRFLCTGTEGGTFYAGEAEHTIENATNVLDVARTYGPAALDTLLDVSRNGLAVKQHPTMVALAALTAVADLQTRRRAFEALPTVCRTPTMLFLYAKYVEQFRGWGRPLKRAVAAWYTDQDIDALAYAAAKYQSREGYTHRDLLRLSHPGAHGAPVDDAHRHLFDHLCGRTPDSAALPWVTRVSLALNAATTQTEILDLIDSGNVSWEMIPSQWLGHRETWDRLIDRGRVPIGALLRNLPRLTNLGVIDPIGDDRTSRIIGRLIDVDHLRKGRVHPMSVLLAASTYASGRSVRGSSTWQPVAAINKALDTAYLNAFGAIVPDDDTRVVIGVDVSASMDTASVAGLPMSCRDAAVALAQSFAAQFPRNMGLAFTGPYGGPAGISYGRGYHSAANPQDNAVVPFDVDPTRRRVDVIAEARQIPFGRTDCALPVLDALNRGLRVDAFIVLTDNETWAGSVHPHEALRMYRERTGINARFVTVAMESNQATIADPTDPGMLDVVGLDQSAVSLATSFIQGNV